MPRMQRHRSNNHIPMVTGQLETAYGCRPPERTGALPVRRNRKAERQRIRLIRETEDRLRIKKPYVDSFVNFVLKKAMGDERTVQELYLEYKRIYGL